MAKYSGVPGKPAGEAHERTAALQITELEFIDAVAAGQLQTEAGAEALRLGEVPVEIEFTFAYVEKLERAVATLIPMVGAGWCGLCRDVEHAPDCIIPALVSKYSGDA